MFRRFTSEEIARLDTVQQPDLDPTERSRYETRSFPRKLDQFLKAEGAVAWARMSIRPNGLVHGEGYLYRVGDTASLPAVELAQDVVAHRRLHGIGGNRTLRRAMSPAISGQPAPTCSRMSSPSGGKVRDRLWACP